MEENEFSVVVDMDDRSVEVLYNGTRKSKLRGVAGRLTLSWSKDGRGEDIELLGGS